MAFAKEILLESGYDWNNEIIATVSKELFPTRKRFDRFNGDNMLRMINLFSRIEMKLTLKEAQLVEAMIANELPLTHSSEISVFNWLKENTHKIRMEKAVH